MTSTSQALGNNIATPSFLGAGFNDMASSIKSLIGGGSHDENISASHQITPTLEQYEATLIEYKKPDDLW